MHTPNDTRVSDTTQPAPHRLPRVGALLAACACVIALSGCATQWQGTDSGVPKLVVQNKSLTPANGGREAKQADLQAGDILLSSRSAFACPRCRRSAMRRCTWAMAA